ncbi:MAG: hypothetical protein ACI9HE_000817 [Planctomycetota bacterium]|jgi:hypothetical protein
MTDAPTYQISIGLHMHNGLSADAGHMEHQAPFTEAIHNQLKRYLRVTSDGQDGLPMTRASFSYTTSGISDPSSDDSIWDLKREQDLADGVNRALSTISAKGTDLRVQSRKGEVSFGSCFPNPRTGEWEFSRSYNLQMKASQDSEWRAIDIAEATHSYMSTRYGPGPISSRDHRALMQLCDVQLVVTVSPAPTDTTNTLGISPLT